MKLRADSPAKSDDVIKCSKRHCEVWAYSGQRTTSQERMEADAGSIEGQIRKGQEVTACQ
jgi:hypothetical protein